MDQLQKDIEKLKALLKGKHSTQEDKEIYAELSELEQRLKKMEDACESKYGSYFS